VSQRSLRFRPIQTARRLRAGESGVTLIELLVATMIFGILMALIVAAFSTFSQTFTKDRVATENTNIASLGMNEVTRVIRASTSLERSGDDLAPFVEAKPEELTLYAYIDTDSSTPQPVKIRFKVDATTRELVETRWKAKPLASGSPYWDFETASYSTKVIARKIVVPATGEQFMFTYFQINSTTLLEEKLTVPTTGLSAADLKKVAVVEVWVKVQSDATGRANPVTIINRVGIPNLGISRLGAPAS